MTDVRIFLEGISHVEGNFVGAYTLEGTPSGKGLFDKSLLLNFLQSGVQILYKSAEVKSVIIDIIGRNRFEEFVTKGLILEVK